MHSNGRQRTKTVRRIAASLSATAFLSLVIKPAHKVDASQHNHASKLRVIVVSL